MTLVCIFVNFHGKFVFLTFQRQKRHAGELWTLHHLPPTPRGARWIMNYGSSPLWEWCIVNYFIEKITDFSQNCRFLKMSNFEKKYSNIIIFWENDSIFSLFLPIFTSVHVISPCNNFSLPLPLHFHFTPSNEYPWKEVWISNRCWAPLAASRVDWPHWHLPATPADWWFGEIIYCIAVVQWGNLQYAYTEYRHAYPWWYMYPWWYIWTFWPFVTPENTEKYQYWHR